VERVAALAEHAAPSNRRMGPTALWRGCARERRLADLENTLRLVGLDPAEHAPLLAPLLDIPLPPERAPGLQPEELRRRQLAAMTALVLAGARSQPIVLAFDDLHWADPTSIDLMRALADRGAQAPLLLLATTRPEFRSPWSLRPHHSLISLSPLDRAGVARMVGEISASHALSKEVIEGVNERTGGVPLFVEEVTRLLLERGEQGGVQAIPLTLQQSLAARLDRLGPAREIAQIGAVLGRDFAYALLRDVAELEEPALQGALDRLADADLLFVEGAPPQASYRFKHALIQDAAYDSLLKSRRQALHRRAAELLRDDPERAAAEPEVVAHHFTQAGLDDLAIEWWGKAGDQALRRSAFQEAIAHLGKAIVMADNGKTEAAQPTTLTGEVNRRLKLQTDYGQAVLWSKGFAAEETKAAFDRARDLAGPTANAGTLFSIYFERWSRGFVCGDLVSARQIAEIIHREAKAGSHATEVGLSRRLLGGTCLLQGDLAEARTHLEHAMADYAQDRDGDARFRFGIDTRVGSLVYLALTLWHLGEVERARLSIDQAIRLGAELGHATTVAHAHLYKAILEARREDATATVDTAKIVVDVSREHALEFYHAAGEALSCWARGRLSQARSIDFERALTNYVQLGNKFSVPGFKGLLAGLEAQSHNMDGALPLTSEALAIAEETGECYTDSFLHRLRGDILLTRKPADPVLAEQAFQTAIAIAKQQGARSYELLASLALAKLYQSTGRPSDAHAVLAPALEGFSPTPEMPEIAEARALLAALAETDPSGTDSAIDAVTGGLRQRAFRTSPWLARNIGGLRQPAGQLIRIGARPSNWRPSMGSGRAAIREASSRQCGLTPRPSSTTSRQDLTLPRRVWRIALWGSPISSPVSSPKPAIIWSWPSLCSNLGVTTTSPIASDLMWVSPPWPIWRSQLGRSATSNGRSP
jgi:predicted ATPase